ncbi:MFS transporter [Polymorphospora rubra]|uniref:MFS transporter n=1 Tax=Polymorphospora rubra TaxID=338584 RepID=A0A810N201_9ACTN|nr:MFS transporter [Polymorphospora rubra]BCJ67472.1 MFS transporter [Polymorphospora rubra]
MSAVQASLPDGGTDRLGRRGRGMLIVLCGAIFLEGIDASMMNVALPSMQDDLDMSPSTAQWVVSAYILGYGGFMLLGGRVADLVGRRRTFLFWLVVFLAFSGLGGLATTPWVLILSRFVTGVAAGFLTPAGLSLITTNFAEGPRRTRALLIYAGIASGGFSFGLVLGGLLTAADWRWVFFAPVILTAVVLAGAVRLIPPDRRPERSPHGFDVAGAVAVTAAMLLVVYAVVRAAEVPVAETVVVGAAGIVALVAFVVIEHRSAAPLIRLGVLRSGALVRANLAAILYGGAFFGFVLITTLYLQQVRGWSPIQTGLAVLAVSIDAILSPTLTPHLVRRFGNARVIFGGFLLAVLAYALFLRIDVDWTYAAILPTVFLLGLSFSLVYGPLTITATAGIAGKDQGLAGGLFNTSFQFGAALGLAVVTAVSIAVAGTDTSRAGLLAGYRAALVVPVVAVVLGTVVAALGLSANRRRDEVPTRGA